MKYAFSIILIMQIALHATQAYAHELSTSYINVSIDDTHKISGNIAVDALDLKEVFALDIDQNGKLSWGELTSLQAPISQYISKNFRLKLNQQSCPLIMNQQMGLKHQANKVLIVLPFSTLCTATNKVNDITINYELFFENVSNHKAVLSITNETNSHEILGVFEANTTQQTFNLESSNALNAFTEFVYQGIFHILIGTDHILFLLTLLLTIVLVREQNQWQAINSDRKILVRTLWVVSSFTLAHSITLSGTALGWLPTFGSWIEIVIAASILFNVINNIFPMISRLGIITFIFGLIHGMGFAGALAELSLPANQEILAVIAFNIGVELGQLAILLVVLPILLIVRAKQFYQRIFMPCLSILIGIVAVFWIIERVN